MNRMFVIAAIIVALGPLGVGQTKSARRAQAETVVEGIRRLDQERIQAQIHADAGALDRIYANPMPVPVPRRRPMLTAATSFTCGNAASRAWSCVRSALSR